MDGVEHPDLVEQLEVGDAQAGDGRGERLGQLGEQLDLKEQQELGLIDEWLGMAVSLRSSRPTGFWTFPVQAVSQSEGGFELVHQSVCVEPHWIVMPDVDDRWSFTMELAVDTTRAEAHQEDQAAVATT